ncbi:MAG: flagellar export protein FliJ [Nitrospinaceae bacterium]|jgi:flagellar FliJ protein
MTFRFESLLRLRKNAENLEQRAMAEMQNHLYARQNELQDLNSSDTKNKDELQTRLQQTIPGRTLGLYDRYFQSLGIRSGLQKQIISETAEKVETKRLELVEAMKKRRVMEILKDREILKKKSKVLKDEIALMDEIASTRWPTGKL